MEIPSGFAQINFMFTGNDVPTGAECTLAVDLGSTDVDPASLGALAATWVNDSDVMDATTVDVNLTGVLVKFGPTATGPSALVAASVSGTYGSSDNMPNCATLIHKTTSFGGRAGRGRLYWPGPVLQEANSSGIFSGTHMESLNTKWGAFFAAIGGDDLTPVLLHGSGSPITTPTPLLGLVPDHKVATQRRRLRR